jgi:S-adenosylmethionine/arginine decarboxylase-like enzyme
VHTHLTADFIGVPPEQLRDSALLGGLLIAAASAAGFSLSGVPIVRELPNGRVSAMVLIDQGHLSVHALPDRQALLFDAVAPASHDFRKALDVLSRRLTARDIKTDSRGRG